MKQVIVLVSAIMIFFCLCLFPAYALQDEVLLRLGRGPILDVAFSPDSKILAVATAKGIYLHSPIDFAEIAFISPGPIYPDSICISPDSKLIASCDSYERGKVFLWDIMTHEKVAEIGVEKYEGYDNFIRFSFDGELIAFGNGDGKIRLLDLAKQKEIGELKGHSDIIRSVCFSPDDSLLASTSDDKTTKLWDMATHKVIMTFDRGTASSRDNAVFSPDGKLLAVRTRKGIVLYDIKQRKERLIRDNGYPIPIAFSPDGKLLASSGMHGIMLWSVDDLNLSDGIVMDFIGVDRFSSDGRFLMRFSQNNIMIQDMVAHKKLEPKKEYMWVVESIAVSYDSRLLASGDPGFVRLWDIENRKLLSAFETIRFPVVPIGFTPSSLAISPDSRFLAAASWHSKNIMVCDIRDMKEYAVINADLPDMKHYITTLAFSPDSQLLAFGGTWGMRLWDVDAKRDIPLNEEPGQASCVAFSPDGELLISAGDNMVRLWDMRTLKVRDTLRQPSAINHFALSGDGRWLALGLNNNQIKLWDMAFLKESATITEESPLSSVAINSNGSLLATVCWFHTNLWDVAKQSKINSRLQQDAYIASLCFSADSRFLASGSLGEIILWDMQPYASIYSDQSVKPDNKLPVPWGEIRQTRLYQNYPNPFNPETWIPYELSEEISDVSIDIYDAGGYLIRKLSLGTQKAGIYIDKTQSAYWDGRNDKGEMVASGVYFYMLRTNSQKLSPRKMIVLK